MSQDWGRLGKAKLQHTPVRVRTGSMPGQDRLQHPMARARIGIGYAKMGQSLAHTGLVE